MLHEEMRKDARDTNNEDAPLKPEPETLHKTDPQENMEGPVSSLLHNTSDGFDTNESQEEADEEKDKKM